MEAVRCPNIITDIKFTMVKRGRQLYLKIITFISSICNYHNLDKIKNTSLMFILLNFQDNS
jgi:hypothetical protein